MYKDIHMYRDRDMYRYRAIHMYRECSAQIIENMHLKVKDSASWSNGHDEWELQVKTTNMRESEWTVKMWSFDAYHKSSYVSIWALHVSIHMYVSIRKSFWSTRPLDFSCTGGAGCNPCTEVYSISLSQSIPPSFPHSPLCPAFHASFCQSLQQ